MNGESRSRASTPFWNGTTAVSGPISGAMARAASSVS